MRKAGNHVALVRSLTAAAFVTVAALRPATADDTERFEAEIKATYLYKFAAFVEWPADAVAGPTSPFRLCVAGDNPVQQVIDHAVEGQSVAGRGVEVRHLAAGDSVRGCHILYVADPDRSVVARMLKDAQGHPVLTVSDAGPSPQHGVMSFAMVADHVRFDVDVDLATEDRLLVSSKLLELAHLVTHAREQKG